MSSTPPKSTKMSNELSNSFSIQSTLSSFLESGDLADVEFIVGQEKVGIKAHKIFLLMRSDVFGSMLSSRWLSDTESGDKEDTHLTRVELPHFEPAVFKTFLKYLYTDQIVVSDTIRGGDELIDLFVMADMYGIIPLQEKILTTLESSLSMNNCVNIYESTKVLNEELSRKALGFIKGNISQLLHHNVYLTTGKDGHWSPNTWTAILQSDDMVVEEVELFVAIVKWAEGDEARLERLQSTLLQLIRYPIMTSEEFAKFVVPTELLQNTAVIKMLLFYIDTKGNHTQSSCLPYTFLSRTVKVATSSTELTYFLKRSSPGDVIQLLNRPYVGSFTLPTSYVTLRGEGPESSITSGDRENPLLSLEGNRCTVSNIRFHHASTTDPRSVKPLIQVNGYHNTLSNLEANTGCYWTEISLPDGSITSNKLLKQNPCFAIALGDGDGHTISNLVCVNRGNGVNIEGKGAGHSVLGVTSIQSTDGQSRCEFGTAVSIMGGTGHTLQDISGDWYLRFGEGSETVTASGCDLLGVTLDGRGHDFVGLKAKKWVKIKGEGHSFDAACQAGRWDGRIDNN
ncbi:uncharacterized protein LOC110847705 [Folsomia candida]|uniref:BTB/POZ domain-containing protein 2 n=1 Tax=Folsomia candida TaxID=158441 RepID=A0A226EIZ4_FOLCA|nr:uncharacterized protein LOC110847705 [Folsomia candida]OXA57602.1 BTB/POZ domain-containing protein 2 [Folsomia candida]